MIMADREGIISTILYGPDKRTAITPDTHSVMFAVYTPPGITPETVREHLEHIQQNVLLVSAHASTELLQVFSAD